MGSLRAALRRGMRRNANVCDTWFLNKNEGESSEQQSNTRR
jgi:hypothetical protein